MTLLNTQDHCLKTRKIFQKNLAHLLRTQNAPLKPPCVERVHHRLSCEPPLRFVSQQIEIHMKELCSVARTMHRASTLRKGADARVPTPGSHSFVTWTNFIHPERNEIGVTNYRRLSGFK